jgi:sarcosine oxidase subunit alpha
MPRRPDPRFAPDCAILVDGRRLPARAGESVTSALLSAGVALVARSAKYHRPRGAFCLSGSCSACLVRVDGVPNVRACETPCREGLRIETQNAIGGAARDLLGAIDVLAPGGIDHHRLATWSHLANRLAVSASRRLAGLGLLPDHAEPRWAATEERFDAVVVGSGPAGLGAAESLALAGRRVLLVEREARLGGRLRCRLDLPGDPPLAWATEVAAAVVRAAGEVAVRAPAIGLWRDEHDALLAIPERGATDRMRLVRSPRVVLAGGTWAQPPLFEGNDLPGILGARGLSVALAEDGVVPGERAAVLGAGPEAEAVAGALARAGMEVELVAEVVRARGRGRLARVELADGRTVRCDVLAVATARMPASELAREVGAALELDPDTGTFRVRPGADGAVAPGVFAAGELAGECTAADAARAGRRAGEAAARG